MSSDDSDTPKPDDAGTLQRWTTARNVFIAVGLIAAVIGALWHQYFYWPWYIEDAAISFAYARNWAEGEGLVAYPGGERLEGYSNFTWVVLLAIGQLLGFDAFDTSKVLQMLLTALTVPMTWLVAREAAPDERSNSPLAAAAYLAIAATYALWAACGLENALFSFILALALWRSSVEIRTGGFPWAAFAWCLLAMSRPEAILYCAVAGFLTMCFTVRAHGVLPTVKWLVAFFVPFGLYHAIRFNYFAYEFPQTYYGKMNNKLPKMSWDTRGWRYIRNWSHDLWTAYFLPLWFWGLLGTRGWRGVAGLVALVFSAFWLMYPSNEALDTVPGWPTGLPAPSWWESGRPYVLVFDALLLPVLAVGGRRGWQTRILCWSISVTVVFFSVYTLGDWMKAWRWMNLLQVPTAVLFAVGAGALADAADRAMAWVESRAGRPVDKWVWAVLQVVLVAVALGAGSGFILGRWWLLGIVEAAMIAALVGGILSERLRDGWTYAGWSVLAIVTALAVPPNVTHSLTMGQRPETGPFAIRSRVEFVQSVKEILEIQDRMVDLDVDMGAHLWWGRDDFAMMDMAGLVDIPLAQHRFERAFVSEYVFKERRPHFAHVHGGWANNSRIPTHPEWRRDYFEIPGYPAGSRKLHIGNHIRRDLVMKRSYDGPKDRRVQFGGGLFLEGFDLPSEPARARTLWVEIAVRDVVTRLEGSEVTLLMMAAKDGKLVQTWDIPLGYGWFAANDWRPEEINVGMYKLPVPIDMEEATYDLAFVFIDGQGRVQGAIDPDTTEPEEGEDPPPPLPEGAWIGGTPDHPAVFATGELVFPGALRVVSLDELSELAKADRELAIEHAKRGRCEDAEDSWDDSRHHRPKDRSYLEQYEDRVRIHIAFCWAWRAEQDPSMAVVYLEKAREIDHHAEGYLKNKDRFADALYAEGVAAMELEDWETAYRKFSDTLRVDPWRSWARRYAEIARAYRLGIDPDSVAEEEAERERQKEEVEARRAKAKVETRADEQERVEAQKQP